MNKVILTGNLVRDPELRATPSGAKVVSNTIAVQREFRNPDGSYSTDFINFVAWQQQAEYLQSYAKKGDRIEIVGRWQVRTYDNKENKQVQVNEVQVESLGVFSKQPKEETKKEPQTQEDDYFKKFDDDDLPF